MEELIPVRFKFGNYSEYKALSSTETGVLYYIIDRGLIFREGNIVTHNLDVSAFIDSSGYECIRLQDNTTYPEISTYEIYQCSAIQNVIENYVDDYIGDSSAMRFMGTINNTDQIPTAAKKGDVYLINDAGQYLGQFCRHGDMIVATETHRFSSIDNPDRYWNIIQHNLEGAVTVKKIETNDYTLDSSCVIVGNGTRSVRKVNHPDKPDVTYVLGLDSSLNPEWRTITDLNIIDASSCILNDDMFLDSSSYFHEQALHYPYHKVCFVNASYIFRYKKIDTSLSLTICNNDTTPCKITIYGMYALYKDVQSKLIWYPESTFSTQIYTLNGGFPQNVHISGCFNNNLYTDENIDPSDFHLMIGMIGDKPSYDITVLSESSDNPPIINMSQAIMRGYIGN